VLVLETMLWPDEIREVDFDVLKQDVDVRPQEVKMASSLIDALSGDFDPTQYSDEYRAALEKLIDSKAEGHEALAPAATAAADEGTVVDLMAALRASVAAAKQARTDDAATG
jgi:DNA end-binding protein Ku